MCGHIVGMFYNIYQANTLIPGTARETARVMGSMLSIGFIMAVVVYIAKLYVDHMTVGTINFIGLMLLVFLGAIVYVGALFIGQRAFVMEIIHIGLAVLGPKLRLNRIVPQRLDS